MISSCRNLGIVLEKKTNTRQLGIFFPREGVSKAPKRVGPFVAPRLSWALIKNNKLLPTCGNAVFFFFLPFDMEISFWNCSPRGAYIIRHKSSHTDSTLSHEGWSNEKGADRIYARLFPPPLSLISDSRLVTLMLTLGRCFGGPLAL